LEKGETVAFVGLWFREDDSCQIIVGLYTLKKGKILFNNIPADQNWFWRDERKNRNFVTQWIHSYFQEAVKENYYSSIHLQPTEECIDVLNKAAAKITFRKSWERARYKSWRKRNKSKRWWKAKIINCSCSAAQTSLLVLMKQIWL